MAMILVSKPVVTSCPADLHNYASRKGAIITGVILHATQGWRAGTVQKFQDPLSQASCHYLVCKDGDIVQSVPDEYAAWHSGNGEYNRHTIGIEIEALVQDLKTKEWLKPPLGFTDLQYKSLLALCKYLVEKFQIKPIHVGRDEPHMIGFRAHADVPNPHHPDQWGGIHDHEDPGPNFPWWDKLMADLKPAQPSV